MVPSLLWGVVMSWIRGSIVRQLIITLATVLALMVGVSFAIAHVTITALEASYESIIFERIIPVIQHMGDAGFDAEEREISRDEAALGDALVQEASASAGGRRDETYAAADFRSQISDRRTRGGIDKPGSLFVVADEAKGVVWIYRGNHAAAGAFQGVAATAFSSADPAALADSLKAAHQSRAAAFNQRRSDLADKRMALSKVKGVVDSSIDQIQSSRQEMAEFKLRHRVNGALAVLAISILGGGLLGVMLYRLASAIVRQGKAIEAIIATAHDPAALEAVVVPETQRLDQLGVVARGIARARDVFGRVHQLEEDRRDSERLAAADKAQSLLALADDFKATVQDGVDKVGQTAGRLHLGAASMIEAVAHTASEAHRASTASGDANDAVRNAAEAAGGMSDSIRAVSCQVEQSVEIAGRAEAAAASSAVTVQALAESAERIGAVVDLINDIAGQTNLLALNATIEAARAGEAGKGFAVVAGEVKQLATQTAKATNEIAAQIQSIQGGARDAVGDIQRFAQVVGEVGDLSRAVAEAMAKQDQVTHDIAESVRRAAAGADAVSGSLTTVSASTQQAEGVAHDVLAAADDLSRLSQILQGSLDSFLHRLQTGHA